MTTSTISVRAPLKGRIVPLGDVPDPMFALGMMGDGLAIEPEVGEVHAPVAGTVTSVHRRGHAVKVMTDDGAEFLMTEPPPLPERKQREDRPDRERAPRKVRDDLATYRIAVAMGLG